jgi:2-polyprenyl-6-methoxyphenol hydroxylase-like FAD-dependent oxidoreductase
MYDAIVVGSRCAGAPTAMLLARQGRRVLLVDRATFPADVLSGHTIQPAGVARLARWGLLDRVRATGVPVLSRVRFDFGPVVLEGTPAPVDGVADTICIRRTVLDALLTDAAAESGVDARQGLTVRELLWEGGRVVGIRGRDASGRDVEERASIVVGADGERSFVARSVEASTYHRAPGSTFTAYSYWRGVDVDAVELATRPGRFFVTIPTNDGVVIAVQMVPVAEAARYRGRVEAAFDETARDVPDLHARLRAGERVERFRTLPTGDGFFRVPAGPGWALVGDAGYHKDPITAQGMLDAFRDAELLADAINRGLDGDLTAELHSYQRDRDAAALPMYEFTNGLAELAPPTPELAGLVAALAGKPTEIARFLGVIAGSVSVPEFFSPESLGRIAA